MTVVMIPNYSLLIPWLITATAAFTAAVIDVRQFRVPNWLTFPLCTSGFLFHLVVNGVRGLEIGAAGFAVGFLVLIVFFVIGAMGAGDVKLLASVGAWLGPAHAIRVFVVAGLAAGVYAAVVYALQGPFHKFATRLKISVLQLHTLSRHTALSVPVDVVVQRGDRRWRVLPFALMIAIGVLVAALGHIGFPTLRSV